MPGKQLASHVIHAALGRFTLKVRGGPNKGMRWIVDAGVHRCWLGTYESEKQTAIVKIARPGMTFYDIGAHAGFYTLLFSRLAGTDGGVYAFEPCPESVRFLLSGTSG